MKTEKLSDYLDLIKSAQEQNKWSEVRRLGESALKKLPHLAHSPRDQYLLYYRLGYNYFYHYQQYSLSVDNFHKAGSIASKHRFEPEYLATVSYMLGLNFLALRNINLALRQYRLVEQYYQKYGYKRPQMGPQQYVFILEGLGYCYLHQNNMEKAREIIEEKIPAYQSAFSDEFLIEYPHLKGEYLTRLKDYQGARLCFQEVVRLCSKEANRLTGMLSGQIHLVILNILEGQPGSAITLLKTILREAGQLSKENQNIFVCEALLLLNKCYALIGSQDKADRLEKRLKSRLKKLDITWFYALSKEVDQIYQQLETAGIPNGGTDPVISRVREHLNERLSSYPAPVKAGRASKPSPEEDRYVLIGKSEVMKEMYQLVEKVAPTNLPILVYGETGTGKELVARAIHQRSLRSQRMWLACNTGAIPETLLESELFGYVRGAFTGAQTDKKGYVELASTGTLFLDEIGSMSLGMQQKLLRVMEDNQLWRVGAETPIQVNTRFVLASNEDLDLLVKEKRFREDLWYRINTIVIALPPLRERKEDIPLLAQHFLKKYASSFRIPHPEFRISDEAFRVLTNYRWPGNVRELENEIKRICTLYPGDGLITESMISEHIRQDLSINASAVSAESRHNLSLSESMDGFEKRLIENALAKSGGNISRAAVSLKCDRRSLHRKINRLKINPAIII